MANNLLKTERRRLWCTLSDEELAGLSQELAQSIQDAKAEEERQKGVKAGLKETMAEFGEKAQRVSNCIVRRAIERDVEVDLKLDGLQVLEVRRDTGEIMLTRPATVQELQAPLFEP